MGTDDRYYAIKLPDGSTAQFPSVMTVLSVLDRRALNNWRASLGKEDADAIANEAADIGSQTHRLIERIIKGGRIEQAAWVGLDMRVQNALRAWWRWKQEVNFKAKHSEMTVYSLKYGYAGTLDAAGTVKPRCPVICDWKTSTAIYEDSNFPQLCAYKMAYLEMFPKRKVTDLYVVRLDKNTGIPEPRAVDEHDYWWRFFLAALNLFKIKQEKRRNK